MKSGVLFVPCLRSQIKKAPDRWSSQAGFAGQRRSVAEAPRPELRDWHLADADHAHRALLGIPAGNGASKQPMPAVL
jgi:hypothetical protein